MPPSPDNRPRISLGNLEWGVIFSIIISAGSGIFSAGIIYSEVKLHERRLNAVESRLGAVDQRDVLVTEKLAKIEANLDFLVDQYRDDRRSKDSK